MKLSKMILGMSRDMLIENSKFLIKIMHDFCKIFPDYKYTTVR